MYVIYTGTMYIRGEKSQLFAFIHDNFKCVIGDGDDRKLYKPCIDFADEYTAYIRQPIINNNRHIGNCFLLPYNGRILENEICINIFMDKGKVEPEPQIMFFNVVFEDMEFQPSVDIRESAFFNEAKKYRLDFLFRVTRRFIHKDGKDPIDNITYAISADMMYCEDDPVVEGIYKEPNETINDWILDTHADHFREFSPDPKYANVIKAQENNVEEDGFPFN